MKYHNNTPAPNVRAAIRLAIRWNRVAKDTSNRELEMSTREFVRKSFAMRNSKNIVVLRG